MAVKEAGTHGKAALSNDATAGVVTTITDQQYAQKSGKPCKQKMLWITANIETRMNRGGDERNLFTFGKLPEHGDLDKVVDQLYQSMR